jgi:hypothetical protein
MKPSEQSQVNFIADCLRKGEQRKVILGKFGKKWVNVSRTTFDRRLEAAKRAVSGEQSRIIAKAEEQVAKEAGELKSKILTSLERQAYLSSLVKGEVEIPYKEVKWNPVEKKFQTVAFVELASHSARIAAIAELNKMDGSHSPTKSEVTLTEAPQIIAPGDEPTGH